MADLETHNSVKEDLVEVDCDTKEDAPRTIPEQTQATIKVDHIVKSRASSRFLDDPDIANVSSQLRLDHGHARMNDTFELDPSSKNVTLGQVLTSNYQKKDVDLGTTRGLLH